MSYDHTQKKEKQFYKEQQEGTEISLGVVLVLTKQTQPFNEN